ncbi:MULTISPECIES: EAL domain-containing protein [Pseudoxanthomonas]|uniref:Diguanylate cyclase (GGDEF)-like protein n=1 Tax=Pseudoxanthomonas winnipegensis TaxID=2480810 RepID=A0AAW8GD54_9GAMM|nr:MULTISPECIES: EAL domain-containing protein [Pseudoxanthomonas]MDQ1119666.1 diguanylate cyclase (GGDEF)-like protein [Pseudoxanthomonas winnipegensis]MDR6137132.1 diguanylate cyclase (GGDEF)-like protein [Pseudoxanthomonas sp. SORGH_AS_0997]
MSGQTATAVQQAGISAVAADAVAQVLCGLLPDSSQVVACWRDWAIGAGGAASEGAGPALRRRAEQALWDNPEHVVRNEDELLLAWSNVEGNARMSLAASLAAPLAPAQVTAWKAAAQALIGAVLEAERAAARVVTLEKSKRLQQALYEIADLASADLEMSEMLARIHAVVGTLMYAENCYIVLYDEVRRTMRFLYFADLIDPYVADPEREFGEEEMRNSMTLALLHHGKPMRGPSAAVSQRLGVTLDASHGPESVDWLGVPMRRDDRVCGAIVVQSYDTPASYTDEDRALLSYVAQHILTALDRRHAHEELEARIEARTRELQLTNRELQAEIQERRRAEKLQTALFRITELANTSASLEEFYAAVHGVVDELIVARNFYIALLDDDGQTLHFPYSVDQQDPARRSRRAIRGLTEYVIRTSRPLLAEAEDVAELVASGQVIQHGPPSYSWLGVPLDQGGETRGCVVVQSYSSEVHYTLHDQNLLSFVAHHFGAGLARQRARESLRAAHLELEARVEARTFELAEANAKLMAQIGERLRAEQRLTYQATHDALTGLPNRAFLLESLTAAIARAQANPGHHFAVLFMDLDRFKLVNDSIGHAAGDELLIEVARRITSQVREGDLVARLGGDEFAMVIACRRGAYEAVEFASRLLEALNRPMWVAGRELFPAASIGIAAWHPRYQRGEDLLRDADAAMYRAKAEGRERSAVFDEHMREAAMQSLDLEADLRRAINSQHFSPHFQPILRVSDGAVVGHEALLRWHHERRGLLLPGQFLAQGEDSGLIEQIDWLLYEQVVSRISAGVDGYVSVNVSPRHFRSPDFASRLLRLLDQHHADPAQLRVEITEIALLDDAPRALRMLEQLRARGVLAQLDDFGTGFSALSYLHRFPISALKIDRSFIAGLGEEHREESLALVRAILALAGTLGIETIAEGVETTPQLAALRELGCSYAQGYLLGRPGPVLGERAL